MQGYIEGGRTGNGEAMKPTFHEDATIFGYVGSDLFAGPIQGLYDWNDENGPATDMVSRFTPSVLPVANGHLFIDGHEVEVAECAGDIGTLWDAASRHGRPLTEHALQSVGNAPVTSRLGEAPAPGRQ